MYSARFAYHKRVDCCPCRLDIFRYYVVFSAEWCISWLCFAGVSAGMPAGLHRSGPVPASDLPAAPGCGEQHRWGFTAAAYAGKRNHFKKFYLIGLIVLIVDVVVFSNWLIVVSAFFNVAGIFIFLDACTAFVIPLHKNKKCHSLKFTLFHCSSIFPSSLLLWYFQMVHNKNFKNMHITIRLY